MSLDSLIGDDQLRFEEALLKNRDNEALWIDYIEACGQDMDRAVFILDRAVTELPASALLWNAYLHLPWGPERRPQLIALYERALSILISTPAYWLEYLKLLQLDIDRVGADKVASALDTALVHLHKSHHGTVWKAYFQIVSRLSDDAAAAVYIRFFESGESIFEGPPISRDTCVLRVAECGQFPESVSLYFALCGSRPSGSESNLALALDLIGLLSTSLSYSDAASLEDIVSAASKDHPEQKSKIYSKAAVFYSLRNDLESARHCYSLALHATNSAHDFARTFKLVTDWEENQLEKLYNASELEELDLRLGFYEQTLQDQKILLNDVLLKASPHCIDFWLDRSQIFANQQKPNEAIGTLVTAIRSINPFAASSFRNLTLAAIWTEYANKYIAYGDVSTANVIFSRAVKSQFKTPDDLAEIYIAWTELMLSVSDEEAIKLIEPVLFVNAKDVAKISYDDKKKPVQERVSKCRALWQFYIDLLQSMSDGTNGAMINEKIEAAYKHMSTLQIITLRMLLDYAHLIRETEGFQRETSIYLWGIQKIKSSEAQFYIWQAYLEQAFKNESDYEALSELLDRSLLSNIPGYLASHVFGLKIDLELKHGKTYKAVKCIENAIEYLTDSYSNKSYSRENRNKIADDKFALFERICDLISNALNDDGMLRDVYAKALQDPHLTVPNVVHYGQKFVDFETKKGEFNRVRELYTFLARLAHPDTHFMKQVWESWEQFEVKNGTEKDIRALLRSKKATYKDFQDVAELKSEINPMGFMKGEETTKAPKEADNQQSNPDAIDLDMDF